MSFGSACVRGWRAGRSKFRSPISLIPPDTLSSFRLFLRRLAQRTILYVARQARRGERMLASTPPASAPQR
jgi:hypothetical protein